MSFILEALKKSENERQRRSGPGLADVRSVPGTRGRPNWFLIFGALVTLNVAVVAAILAWRGSHGESAPVVPAVAALPDTSAPVAPPPQPRPVQPPQVQAPKSDAVSVPAPAPVSAPAPAPAPAAAVAPAPEAPAQASPTPPTVRPLETEAQGATVVAAPEPETSLAPAPAAETSPAAVSQPAATPDIDPALTFPEPDYAEVPNINEVFASGMLAGLPPLHMDIHVYSDVPSERFVFVNLRKYQEGDELDEGPYVERITPQGVVLNHRRVRFLLPRE